MGESNHAKKNPSYNPETEMERIAREAREFREQEARRIAEEKEEARRAMELEKQQLRERIALKSNQFLQAAAKEREENTRSKASNISSTSNQQPVDQKPAFSANVSEKAKRLLEKEEVERQRLEEERTFALKRSRLKNASEDPASIQSTLQGGNDVAISAFSQEDSRPVRDTEEQESVYYDAAMSQSSLEKSRDLQMTHRSPKYMTRSSTLDSERSTETEQSQPLDVGGPATVTFSLEKARQTKTEREVEESTTSAISPRPTSTNLQGHGDIASLTESDNSGTLHARAQLSSKQSIYTDARESFSSEILETRASPAGAMARDLAASTPSNGVDHMVLTPPRDLKDDYIHQQDSIMSRTSRHIHQTVHPKKSPRNDDALSNSQVQNASFEIPMQYQGEEKGLQLLGDAEAKMKISMPSSRVNGRWSALMEGRATLVPNSTSSTSSGSITMNYKLNNWNTISLGTNRGQERSKPLVSLGISSIWAGSLLGATLFASTDTILRSMDSLRCSLMYRYVLPKTHWIFSSEISQDQEVSMGISNSKLSGSLVWPLRQPLDVAVRADLSPRISEDRRLQIIGEWKRGAWQVSASVFQSLHSQIATVGLGVRLISFRGLEWIFSWNRGNATFRIPVIVANGISQVHVGYVLYLSLVSFLIQEGIAEIWGWKHSESLSQLHDTPVPATADLASGKSREDAELQQKLMNRQAKRKAREESEKDGLVIDKATYKIEGGTEWDTTIPLQFWVNQSSLRLPAKSKCHLLGFYNLSTAGNESTLNDDTKETNVVNTGWWRPIWNDLFDLSSTTPASPPGQTERMALLNVHYTFRGKKYEVTIKDDDELVIPDRKDTRIG